MIKQKVFIDFLKDYISDNTWRIKAEYSTNDNDTKVIVVQEQTGQKVVFYGDVDPLFNYYQIVIYGTSIEENKEMALKINELIGTDNLQTKGKETYQILIKQFSNFQTIEYMDIRRVGYAGIVQCIISKIKEA